MHPRSLALRRAVSALDAGGVVACPTEAVWGLSCDPDDQGAVYRVLELKRRDVAKGLILVAADESQIAFLLAGLPAELRQRASDSWPGPNTWLIPHRGRLQPWVHGEHDTVAVRVSAHPVLRSLCQAWGGPLVSTSANPGGARPAVAAYQVRRYFGDQLDFIMPGAVGRNPRPSTIRELATGAVIRD